MIGVLRLAPEVYIYIFLGECTYLVLMMAAVLDFQNARDAEGHRLAYSTPVRCGASERSFLISSHAARSRR